jgi:hypothetical protein
VWALALLVWRAQSLSNTRAGTEYLRFARPTVSAIAVMFGSAWPDLPGLSAVTQVALLVALIASVALALVARLTQGRAYLALMGLALVGAASLATAAVTLLTSGVPLSETAASLTLQVTLLVALSNGAWRLQRQLVLADTDAVVAEPTVKPRGIDRVASGVYFAFLASIVGPVWIGRYLVGDVLVPVAVAVPNSPAAKLFNAASPWFYAYGAALASVVYAAVLLVPPYRRRGRLVALGCTLGVLSIGPGITTFAEEARAAATSVAQQVRATPVTADQLGWVCTTWSSPDTPGTITAFSGDNCRTLVTYEGQVKTGEVQLQRDLYNDTAVSSVHSNSLNAGKGFLHGAYGTTFIAVAESPAEPGGHVLVAYDITTGAESWTFTCPAGAPSFGTRFSGSSDGDEPALNRETLELYGLMSYVAVDCGSGLEYVVRPEGTIVGQ